MQALVTEPPGGWAHTALCGAAEPQPDDDHVVLEIRCAALNPADRFLIEGSYPGGPPPPFVAGRDASGVVARADSAGRWSAGAEAVVLQSSATDLAHGTFSQRQRVPAAALVPLPAGWSFAEGAAGPLVLQTAWQGLVDKGRVQPGDAVAVTGASGGVGLAAVQLALGLGAEVIALSRSSEKRHRLKSLGAHHAYSPGEPDLKKQVAAAIGRDGVDVVIENVGGASLKTSVHLLGVRGRIAVVGLLAGVEGSIPIPSLMFKRAAIHGVYVSDDPPETAAENWRKITETLAKTGARPVIDSIVPLADYRSAFDRLSTGTFGKVVLRMAAETGN